MTTSNNEWDSPLENLDIVYPDGQTAIAIGPGPEIDFYDDNTPQNLVSQLTPMQWTMGQAGGPQNTMTMSPTEVTNAFPLNNAATPELRAGEVLGSVVVNGAHVAEQFTMAAPILTVAPESIALYALSPTLDNNGAGPVVGHAKIGVAYTPNQGVTPPADLLGLTKDALVASVPVLADLTYTGLPLTGGWGNAGAPFHVPGYIKEATNKVRLRGVISGGTNTNGTQVATLPAGYRPSATVQLVASADGTISPGVCILHIDTSGIVTVFGLGTAHVIGFDDVAFDLA